MPTSIDKIRIVRLDEVVQESPTVRTLLFEDELCESAKPGQFTMVWMPGIEELPMSVMISEKAGHAAVTIRKHGRSSTALYNTPVGGVLGVRGPYGNSFDVEKKKVLLVGGGTGLVPMLRLSREMAKKEKVKSDITLTLIIGAKTKDEVIFEELARRILKNINNQVIVTTEDGSYGVKGLATTAAENAIKEISLDMIYTCGPERMMKKVLQMATSHGIPSQASLERIMKCGIGICCSCCIGKFLVCKDGPVMGGQAILNEPEFGSQARDKSGRMMTMW